MKLKALSKIPSTQVEFFWRPYIIANALNIMEGDPSVGKSYISMHLAAIASRGGYLPDRQKLEPSVVFYLSAEDDNSYTIRPRIEAMGGDTTKIHCLYEPFSLSEEGIESLKTKLELWEPSLIIIDTLFSFTPDYVDTSKPTAVREFLWQLSDIASKSEVTIILIRHWTKGERGKAIYRGGGLIDFTAVARSVVAVAKNPENADERLLAHVKHNLSECGPTRLFVLKKKNDVDLPVVVWKGISDFTADQIESSSEQPAALLDMAIGFLEDVLAQGSMAQKEIEAKATRMKISKRTLDRAKGKLRIVSRKEASGWMWSLPTAKPKPRMPK